MRAVSSRALQHALVIILSLGSLYPLWFVVQTTLKANSAYVADPTGLPVRPTFGNLVALFRTLPFARWLLNSVAVVAISGVATLLIAVFASYAIAYGKFRARNLLLSTNMALMALPPVALIVPLFTVMVSAHLINTLPSVMIVYGGLQIPFSIFFLVSFFRELPRELLEAATVDGASQTRILFRVVLPLSGATIFTLALVNAIWAWNELLYALVFLQSDSERTVMAGLALSQGRYATNEPLVMAGSLVSIVPILILYLAGQRFFVRGLTAGMGK